jgi:hypothetical protein
MMALWEGVVKGNDELSASGSFVGCASSGPKMSHAVLRRHGPFWLERVQFQIPQEVKKDAPTKGASFPNSPNRSIDRTLDRTFRVVFRLPDTSCSKRQKHQKGQKRRRNPVVLAKEWKEALDRGEYDSQADLARNNGISRARVTQILNLLKLDPEVQETVVKLGDPVKANGLTERKLRAVAQLSAEKQRSQRE